MSIGFLTTVYGRYRTTGYYFAIMKPSSGDKQPPTPVVQRLIIAKPGTSTLKSPNSSQSRG